MSTTNQATTHAAKGTVGHRGPPFLRFHLGRPARDAIVGAFLLPAVQVALDLSLKHPGAWSIGTAEVGLFVFGGIAGAFFGWFIGTLRETHEILESAKIQFDVQTNELRVVAMRLSQLVSKNEFWTHIETLLKEQERQFPVIKKIFENYLTSKEAVIGVIPPGDFYGILETALLGAQLWQGIHQGEIERLCENRDVGGENLFAKRQYLRTLRKPEFSHVRKQRVIILQRKDEATIFPQTTEQESESASLLKEFWESAGEAVESFVVFQDQLAENLGKRPEDIVLHDCALYDEEILLHYNRDTRNLVIGGPKSERAEIIRKIFEGIKRDDSLFVPIRALIDRSRKAAVVNEPQSVSTGQPG